MLWNAFGRSFPPPTWSTNGTPGLGQTGPHRVEVDVGGREVPGRVGGHPHGSDARIERDRQGVERAARVVERQVADGLQALVGGAEVAVMARFSASVPP